MDFSKFSFYASLKKLISPESSVPAFGILTSAVVGIGTLLAQAHLIHSVKEVVGTGGNALEKIFIGFSENSGLALGVIAVSLTTGSISYVAFRQLPSPQLPAPLQDKSSEEQKVLHVRAWNEYYQQRTAHTLMTLGFVTVISVVFIGGVALAYSINDSKYKLEVFKIESENSQRINFVKFDDQIRAVFEGCVKARSPSFALFYNDTAKHQTIWSQHTYGISPSPKRSYDLNPFEYKVIEGKSLSTIAGAGLSVTRDKKTWETIGHGTVLKVSSLK